MNQTETVPRPAKRIFGPYRADAARPDRSGSSLRIEWFAGWAARLDAGISPMRCCRGPPRIFRCTSFPNSARPISHRPRVLAAWKRNYNTIQGYFNGIAPDSLPFNVVIAQNVGGAYHYGCLAHGYFTATRRPHRSTRHSPVSC